MTKIYINGQDRIDWFYDDGYWKDYICAEFDETFVLCGNRSFVTHKEASWFKKMYEILKDISIYDYEPTELVRDYNISYPMAEKMIDLVNLWEDIDSLKMWMDCLRVLYPDSYFYTRTIRGFVQSDWQEVICKASSKEEAMNLIAVLEEVYFGDISEVWSDLEESHTEVVLSSELREHSDDLDSFLKGLLDIPMNEKVKIYQANGYIQKIRWEEM